MQYDYQWIRKKLLIVFVLLLSAGCATLDKNECVNADWQAIGYEDGARGYKASRISQHRKACSSYGVTPDFNLYETGYQKGLYEWCTPGNAYRLGIQGKRYNGVCVNVSESEFLNAYNQGREIYIYQKEVGRQEGKLRSMMTRLYAVERDIKTKEAELVAEGTSSARRIVLLKDIRKLEEEYSYQMDSIADQEQVLDNMKNKLAQMKAVNMY